MYWLSDWRQSLISHAFIIRSKSNRKSESWLTVLKSVRLSEVQTFFQESPWDLSKRSVIRALSFHTLSLRLQSALQGVMCLIKFSFVVTPQKHGTGTNWDLVGILEEILSTRALIKHFTSDHSLSPTVWLQTWSRLCNMDMRDSLNPESRSCVW